LALLLGREDVDDAVDRLRGRLGVQGGEHEVPGLRRGQRGRHRLEVAHLADEDHIGVLTQSGLQRQREVLGVSADLALVDDAALVLVEELDRVLDREDVLLALLVDDVHHRGERGRLARAGRAGDEHEPARLARELLQHLGQAQLLELRDAVGDQPEGRGDRTALEEDVDAEAGDAGHGVREVDLLARLEALALIVVEDAVGDVARVLRRQQPVLGQRDDAAAHAQRGREARAEVDVGGPFVGHPGQDLREIEVLGWS
jgi:hypothetical protein